MDFLDTDTSLRSQSRSQADESVTALYSAHAVGLLRLGSSCPGTARRGRGRRAGRTPRPLRGLGLARRPGRRADLRAVQRARRLLLAAAAAVVALDISLVLVKGMQNGSAVPSAPATSADPAPATRPDGVPRYYFAVTEDFAALSGSGKELAVTGVTATGGLEVQVLDRKSVV